MANPKIKLELKDRAHGCASTYLKYKCRCEPCAAAAKVHYGRKNANRRAKSAKKRAHKIDAQPLVAFISASQPEVYEKYKDKLGGWTTFGIDIWAADRICISLATHPVSIFGQL
jgi:hypothetical protein